MKFLWGIPFLILVSAGIASAVLIDTIDANNRGYFRNDGFRNSLSQNTLTGFIDPREYHPFFVFDLSGVTTSVLTSTLRLELENYTSSDGSQTFDLFDVSTSEAQLGTSFASGNSTGQAIYTDLGSGNTYGSATVIPGQVGSVIDITLNAQAVTDMNAAAGGPFSVGIQLRSPFTGTVDIIRFSDADEARTHQLELTLSDPPPPPQVSLPEPGTSAACLLLLFFGLGRRLRKNRS